MFYLAWIIKSINANIFFSLQDDYLKNPEENMRSDESKWGKKQHFIWLVKIFSAVDKLGGGVSDCVVSLQVAAAICKDFNYLNAQFFWKVGRKPHKLSAVSD